jgi:hypothetical protein
MTHQDNSMSLLKPRRNTADGAIEAEKPSAADWFAQVLAHLNLEYDLSADVLTEAEEVLHALKAREGT